MYKNKDKQRQAQRNWVRQKRATKGSTEQGSTDGSMPIEVLAEVDAACGDKLGHGFKQGVTDVVLTPCFTPKTRAELIAEVRAMSAAEVKTMLDGWAETKGTIYQYRLAMLGRQYRQ